MATIDQGCIMKKSIVILLLSVIQSACSSQPRNAGDAGDAAVLLSFEQISAEISVLREADEGGNDPIYTAGRGVATGQ